MRTRTFSILLVSFALLAPLSRPACVHAPTSGHPTGRLASDLFAFRSVAGCPAPLGSLARLAPWRYRLKSVLESRVADIDRVCDRGPAPIADFHHRSFDPKAVPSLTAPLIARRC